MFSLVRGSAVNTVRAFSTSRPVLAYSEKTIKKLQEAGLPIPPKEGGAPYNLFISNELKNNAGAYAAPDGKANFAELNGKLSAAWKALSEPERQKWIESYKQSRKEYGKAFIAFLDALQPGQLRKIRSITGKSLRVPSAAKEHQKAFAEEQGMPPKPTSPFFVFLKDYRKANPDVTDPRTMIKNAAPQWKAMSDAEKEPYFKVAKEIRDTFQTWKDVQSAKDV